MILGIDQGTTGSTAVLLNEKGDLVSQHSADVPQHFPQASWVEHDPKEILRSVAEAVTHCISKAEISPSKIQVIGITNQRETVSLFRDEEPLHRFIVWQDRRTHEDCRRLRKFSKKVRSRSGTPLDPYFSSTKIRWLKKKLGLKASDKNIRFRTIESFLLKKFTGEDVTEISNAHRTQLVNLKKLSWDSELFDIFGVSKNWAPQIIPSEGMNLKTKDLHFLPDGIPVQGVLGDQQAALFGQLGWSKGLGKITFGTGSFILVNTGKEPVVSKSKLVSTVAIQNSKGQTQYALEGSAFICGAWIQWLRDQLGILGLAEESETLAKQVDSSDGVLVVPALSGMGAPFWKPELRGMITGLTRGSNKKHIARASLEALCFQNRALAEAIKADTNMRKIVWRVDGGAVKNNLLMQTQADVLRQKVIRPKRLEATAIGAALLAARGQGLLSESDIQKHWKQDRVFEPNKKSAAGLNKIYDQWVDLVESS